MNLSNILSPHTGRAPGSAPPQLTSKSFTSNISGTFQQNLDILQAEESTAGTGGAPGSALTARQNLVTPATNSNSTSGSSSSGPASSSTPNPAPPAGSSGTSDTGTMTVDEAKLILATGQGDLATAYQVYYGPYLGSGQQPVTTPTPPVTPSSPPTMYTPTQSVSADPGVFTTADYSKELEYSSFQLQANMVNQQRYDNYLNAFTNWKMNGSQGQPPTPPLYETVDRAGFENWWSQYQAGLAGGAGAPDTGIFLTNATPPSTAT